MARKLKAAELFLSLGVAVSLLTACGPKEGGGAASDEEATPAPTEEAQPEGGEGDEGASIDRGLLWAAVLEESAVV